MNEELKPCPFCGSPAKIRDNKNGSYWGQCDNDYCLCELGTERSYTEAVVLWNTRC